MSQAICCPQCQALLPDGAQPDTPCPDCLMKLGLESWRAKRSPAPRAQQGSLLPSPVSGPQTAIMYAAGITLMGAFACMAFAALGSMVLGVDGWFMVVLGGGLFFFGLILATVLFVVALTVSKGGAAEFEHDEELEKSAASLSTDDMETIRQRLRWPAFGLRMAGLLSLLPVMTIGVFIFIIIVIQFTNQTH